jgi:hypothetical protein
MTDASDLRLRFRFTLRSLFFAVLLIAALVELGHQQREIARLRRDLKQLQSEHDSLKALVVNPPARVVPLALR